VGFWVARTVARLSWPGLDGMVACIGCWMLVVAPMDGKGW
jgi:hypothetical protein